MTWRNHVQDEADKDLVRRADRIRLDAQKVARKAAKAVKLQRARELLAAKEAQFRQPRARDAAFLSWLRRAPCLVCAILGEPQTTRTEAAHIRRSYPEPGWRPVGGAEKPSDLRAIPLSAWWHRLAPNSQHAEDSAAWYEQFGIYPPSVCAELKAAQEAGADPVDAVTAIAGEIRNGRGANE